MVEIRKAKSKYIISGLLIQAWAGSLDGVVTLANFADDSLACVGNATSEEFARISQCPKWFDGTIINNREINKMYFAIFEWLLEILLITLIFRRIDSNNLLRKVQTIGMLLLYFTTYSLDLSYLFVF